jgi:hypothetical protein
MAKGWHEESKRHSIAAKFGQAGSKDTAISPMSSNPLKLPSKDRFPLKDRFLEGYGAGKNPLVYVSDISGSFVVYMGKPGYFNLSIPVFYFDVESDAIEAAHKLADAFELPVFNTREEAEKAVKMMERHLERVKVLDTRLHIQRANKLIKELIKSGSIKKEYDGLGNFVGFVDEAGHTYEDSEAVLDAFGD